MPDRSILAAWILLGAPAVGWSFQSPAKDVAFDAASFKTSQVSGNRLVSHISRGHVDLENISLRGLIMMAYEVRAELVIGPDWLDAARYDVSASMPPGSRSAQMYEMLRNLLAERINLSVHEDVKQGPVYALEVAKGGLKIQRAATSDETTDPLGPPYRVAVNSTGRVMTGNITTDTLASFVGLGLDRPVINATALEGAYEVRLEWTPVYPPSQREQLASGVITGPSEFQFPDPSPLFNALERQLGISVRPTKGPIRTVVVDHAQRVPIEQ